MLCNDGSAPLSPARRNSSDFVVNFVASLCRIALALLLLLITPPSRAAEEKKPEKKKEPPRVVVCIPLSVVPGTTNKIKIRGLNLTNVTEIRFADGTNMTAKIKSTGKADVPKDQDAKKSGDTQLEVELILPESTPPGTNSFTLISSDGESAPHTLLIAEPNSLVSEKEPNGSFRQAQPIQFGKAIQGAIGEPKDVDVFRFEGKGGDEITAEVLASRYGSPLDSILTLYDEKAHIIASSDDNGNSTDALLRVKIPADGTYFVSLIDAHDHGGAPWVYLLVISAK